MAILWLDINYIFILNKYRQLIKFTDLFTFVNLIKFLFISNVNLNIDYGNSNQDNF